MQLLTPGAGFDDPLGVLSGCHRRIEGFCDTLERLSAHVRTSGADAEAKTAARRILAYFDRAASHHHADEEVDLLPLMLRRATAAGDAEILASWARRIAEEHRAQSVAWSALRRELLTLTQGRISPLEAGGAFIALERTHYRFEDDEVFPLARVLLTGEDLTALGRAMAQRRHVPYPENV